MILTQHYMSKARLSPLRYIDPDGMEPHEMMGSVTTSGESMSQEDDTQERGDDRYWVRSNGWLKRSSWRSGLCWELRAPHLSVVQK